MAKPSLILLPGLLSDEELWEHQKEHLEELLPCHIIPLISATSTQGLLKIVLEQIHGNFYLAGHSMGGWFALELARIVPERILKLCLINTSAQPDSVEKSGRRVSMMEQVKQEDFAKVARNIADYFVYNQAVKEKVLAMFLRVGSHAFINQQQTLLTRDPCISFLENLKMPTLVIHSSQDRNFSIKDHQELASKIPKAKLAILEDCGHMSPMESPAAITAFLRFWLTY